MDGAIHNPDPADAQRLRELVDHIGAIVWEAELPSWRFTYVSRHAEAILGYSCQQWLDDPKFWVAHLHPTDQQQAVELCKAATERGEDHELEYRMVAADGSTVWLQDIVRVAKDADGTPVRLSGLMIDVTARREAEEAQRRSEERSRLLLDFARSTNSTLDLQTQLDRLLRDVIGVIPAAQLGAIYLYDADDGLLYPAAWQGLSSEAFQRVRLTRGESISGKVFETNRPFLSASKAASDAFRGMLQPRNGDLFEQARDGEDVVSNVATPLREADGAAIGSISLGSKVASFNEDDLALLEGIAAEAGMAIQNARLHRRIRMHAHDLEQEVADRRRAESRLFESEQRFRTLVENSYDVVVMFSAEGECLYVSPAITRVLGYEPDELIGQIGPTIVHPDDTEDAGARFAESLRRPGEGIRMSHRLRHKDGSYRIAEMIGTNLLAEPGVNAIVSIFRDVTTREKAVAELEESEAKFRALSEQNPAMVAIMQGVEFRYTNPALQRALGRTPDELVDTSFLDIVHPEDRRMVQERSMRRQRGEPMPPNYEFRIVDARGDAVWLDFSGVLIEYRDAPAVLGIGIDITQRKQAAEQVRQRELELAHISRISTMGEMVGGIAHEISQPLSAVSNYAEACNTVLQGSDLDTAQLLEWTEKISQQALRCGDIIRRLRNFVKTSDRDWQSVDMTSVVRESLALVNPDLRHTPIRVRCQLPDQAPAVRADPIELQQVIVNLLRNAIDASECEGLDEPQIAVYARVSPRTVTVSVNDNGVGLDAEIRDRVFDPFFTTKLDGLGMGLAISRTIVENHRGRLWAEPYGDKGTSFKIELPLAEEER